MVKLIEKIKAAEAEDKPWVAFEFYPPRTADGVANLYKRFDRMTQQSAWSTHLRNKGDSVPLQHQQAITTRQ